MQYNHTQYARLYILLVVVGIWMLVGAWWVPETVVRIVMACGGGLTMVIALSFRQLTVSDEYDRLVISFGPLPLFRRRILYANIKSVQRSRTTLLEGWGIHLSPGGGWVWNLWGFDCVDVYFKKGKRLRIGTDDPKGLESFLQERITRETP